MTTQTKPSKAGVKAALLSLGFTNQPEYMPSALLPVSASPTFSADEMAFAQYLVHDNDFGAAWNDVEQINMHTV